jgi:hypothetical protein
MTTASALGQNASFIHGLILDPTETPVAAAPFLISLMPSNDI